MRVGIVGASGQLGRKVLVALADRVAPDDLVVALVRTPARLDDWVGEGREVRRADYDDPASLRTAFQSLDRVLLIPSMAPPVPRIVQYDHAISAARDAGGPHLFHFGIVGTAPESCSNLMPFMLYAESALRTSGLEWTILRNGLYMEPIAAWVPEIVRMGTIPYPTKDGRCAYVARDDIASATAGALLTDGHEGAVYHLTGPEALSTADLCAAVAEVTGADVVDRRATDEDYLEICRESNEPEFVARALLSLYGSIARGEMETVSRDVELLSGRPPESFVDFLRRSVVPPA